MPATDLKPTGADSHEDGDDISLGLDALESPSVPATRRAVKKAVAPLAAIAFVLVVWQLAYALGVPSTLPAPASVAGELGDLWRDGTLLPALGHSLERCLFGFAASVLVGAPLGLLVHRYAPVRTVIAPVLSAFQSLPAAALVPLAVIALGESEQAVYAVILLGAVPSVSMGLVSALDQIPPLLRRAGVTMGATGVRAVRKILLPAALPGLVAALRQGWTFGWRALMTAELITATPLPGVGQILNAGKESKSFTLIVAAVIVILAIGVLVEALIFRPVERRVLRDRGLAGPR